MSDAASENVVSGGGAGGASALEAGEPMVPPPARDAGPTAAPGIERTAAPVPQGAVGAGASVAPAVDAAVTAANAECVDPAARAEWRARVLAQFEAWLDETLADEPLPQGLDDEVVAEYLAAAGAEAETEPPDGGSLYDLWAAMTALTQEVKIQGRTFRQLTDAVAPVAELDRTVHDALAAHDEALAAAERLAGDVNGARNERQREAVREVERRAAKAALDALMDTRDRLRRGLATAWSMDAVRAGWFVGLVAPGARRAIEAVAALREGYVMALARLDECLHEHGLREIEAAGAVFDPRRMRAAEAVVTDAAPDGTVIEVLRPGYESDDGVVRVAEVRVARRA